VNLGAAQSGPMAPGAAVIGAQNKAQAGAAAVSLGDMGLGNTLRAVDSPAPQVSGANPDLDLPAAAPKDRRSSGALRAQVEKENVVAEMPMQGPSPMDLALREFAHKAALRDRDPAARPALAQLEEQLEYLKKRRVGVEPSAMDVDPGSKGVAEERAKEILAELAGKAKLRRVPALTVVDHWFPNARAKVGLKNPVEITSAMLADFSEDDVTAVLAHEIGHLKGGRRRILQHIGIVPVVSYAILLALAWVVQGDFNTYIYALMGAGFLSALGGMGGALLFEHNEEFVADAKAAQLTGNPALMRGVLQKLHVISTDPALPERISRLQLLERSGRAKDIPGQL
jgi:Zn-dependent protease with chaperone function